MWSNDNDFKGRISALCNPVELAKPGAKLPFFAGYNFKQFPIADSGEYETLWPIYPVPLFIIHEDYSCIVTSMDGSLSTL